LGIYAKPILTFLTYTVPIISAISLGGILYMYDRNKGESQGEEQNQERTL
jgi:hypothetical protein